MKSSAWWFGAALTVLCTACASTKNADTGSGQSTSPAAAAPPAKPAGRGDSPVTGTPRPGGRFAQLAIGMDMGQVQMIMGAPPNRIDTHETGKRWIPYYFGEDVRRLEALYVGDGCLTFSHGNRWGYGGGELIAIDNDASGACFGR